MRGEVPKLFPGAHGCQGRNVLSWIVRAQAPELALSQLASLMGAPGRGLLALSPGI